MYPGRKTSGRMGEGSNSLRPQERIQAQLLENRKLSHSESVIGLLPSCCPPECEGVPQSPPECSDVLVSRQPTHWALTALFLPDLSFNNIEAIEGLDTLVNLEDLSLFNNRIAKIDSLDALVKLQVLSLGNNQIGNMMNVSSRPGTGAAALAAPAGLPAWGRGYGWAL